LTALDVALALADHGLPVFPCGRNKKPCIPKDEGGRGFHDATTTPDRIRDLFGWRGAVLVGVPTGEASGFDAIDLDYRNGAAEWEQANLHRIPETRIHQTRSGSRHLLFIHAPGVRNSASKKGLAPGVDVRGEGGYVIHPPSTGYSIISDAPIAHWPDWLLPLVLPTPRERPRPTGQLAPISDKRWRAFKDAVLATVKNAPQGSKHFTVRNAALSLGGIAARAGFSDDDLTRDLVEALPGTVLDWNGARETIAWGLQNGRDRPLELEDRPNSNPPDPRRKEIARAAFRMLRVGVAGADLIKALHDHNRQFPDPLPYDAIGDTALWAARQLREAANAPR